MLSIAIRHQLFGQESSPWKPADAATRNDIILTSAGAAGLVGAAIFLFLLGPALGMALVTVTLTVWWMLRSQLASDKDDSERGQDAVSNAPARPAVRQGA